MLGRFQTLNMKQYVYAIFLLIIITVQVLQIDTASSQRDKETDTSTASYKEAQSRYEEEFRGAQDAVEVMQLPWRHLEQKAVEAVALQATVKQLKVPCTTQNELEKETEYACVHVEVRKMREECREQTNLIQSQLKITITTCQTFVTYLPFVEKVLRAGEPLPYYDQSVMKFAQTIADENRPGAKGVEHYSTLFSSQLSYELDKLQTMLDEDTGACKKQAARAAKETEMIEMKTFSSSATASNVAQNMEADTRVRQFYRRAHDLPAPRTSHSD